MDTITQRLDKAREIGGFKSKLKMCESLNISYNTMNNWIKNNKISSNGVIKITKSINISEEYLQTGEGEAELKKERSLEDLTEEELIALLPKDQQVVIESYRKLSDDKKKEHRDKLLIEASEAEIGNE